MKKYVSLVFCFLGLIGVFLGGCKNKSETRQQAGETEDTRFDTFKNNLVLKFWRIHPEWASSVGYHRYDNILTIPDNKYRRGLVRSYKSYLKELEAFAQHKLSENNQTDFYMLQNFLAAGIWQVDEFKDYKWNPAIYNIGPVVADMVNGRYDSLDNRLRTLSQRIAYSTAYYEAAIDNVKNPTVEHTQLAILQNKGALSVLGSALVDSVQASHLNPAEKNLLNQRIETTRLAIDNYIRHLQENILPAIKKGKTRSFRIGQSQYTQKFNFENESGYTANEIYQRANLEKHKIHRAMLALTKQLWPKYFPKQAMPAGLPAVKQMINRLSQQHVPRDSFITAIRQQIPALEKFVNTRHLLTQDPTQPLIVRATPLYMQGVAGASVSAPGPYEKNAATYYNVTPLTHYTPAQAESYLREYNTYTLQILNIHEAIPGHYTQLVYSNKSPSVIKAILGNNAMIEGWAVYAERMMLEQGYGRNSPEMWLMWYKWNLRVTLNAILDYSVHVLNMSEEEALQLLTQEGFQEEAEAREKWKRVTISQVQLTSYFTGYTEIMNLRDELKSKAGKNFNLKNFHEKFLSYGSAPVRYIRDMMLEN